MKPPFRDVLRLNVYWHVSSFLLGCGVILAIPLAILAIMFVAWVVGSMMDPHVIYTLKTGRLP
jgi:hypothetical protein